MDAILNFVQANPLDALLIVLAVLLFFALCLEMIVIAQTNYAYRVFFFGVSTGRVIRRFGLKWPLVNTVKRQYIGRRIIKVRDKMLTLGRKNSVVVEVDIPVIPDTERLDQYTGIADEEREESLLSGASAVVRAAVAVVTTKEAQEDALAVETFIAAMLVLSERYGSRRDARRNFLYVRSHLDEVREEIRQETSFGTGEAFTKRRPGTARSRFETVNAVEALGASLGDFDPDESVIKALEVAARVEARGRVVDTVVAVAKKLKSEVGDLSGPQILNGAGRLLGLSVGTETVQIESTGKGSSLNIVDVAVGRQGGGGKSRRGI